MEDSPYDIEPAPSTPAHVPAPAAFGRSAGIEPELRASIDEAGRLVDEIMCRRCGYNLRGLDLTSKCPECSTAVGRSVRGDLLEYCDPDWVEKLASGARYLVGVIIATVGGILLALLLLSLLPVGPAVALLALFGAAVALLQLVAYWLITSPDPGAVESDATVSMRIAARYLLVGSSIASIVLLVFDLAIGATTTAGLDATVFAGLAVIVDLAGVAGFFTLCIYAGRLAARLPDDDLRRSTRIVMWGYGICASLLALSDVLGDVLGCMSIVALVFLIWGARLVFRYRDGLVYAAEAARRTWART